MSAPVDPLLTTPKVIDIGGPMMQIGKIINIFGGEAPKPTTSGVGAVLGVLVGLMALVGVAMALSPLVVATGAALTALVNVLWYVVLGLFVAVVGIGLPMAARWRLQEARTNRRVMDEHNARMMGVPVLPAAPERPALPPRTVFATSARGDTEAIEIEREESRR